jgi:hypothetical protein
MTKKEFDAVQNMRRIRDELSAELAELTYEQQRQFIDRQRRSGVRRSPIQRASKGRRGRTGNEDKDQP